MSLFATGHYQTPALHFDRVTGTGKPFHYYAYGAAVSEVEVDGFTGQYRLCRTDILHDVGDSLSDRPQVEGGFIQVGCHHRRAGLSRERQLALSGASTWLPSLGSVPGGGAALAGGGAGRRARGKAWEPPFMLAISVREALREAVAAFGDSELVELALPATPEAVFWAIERTRRRATP